MIGLNEALVDPHRMYSTWEGIYEKLTFFMSYIPIFGDQAFLLRSDDKLSTLW